MLLHNREGRNREFADAVNSELKKIVKEGKAVIAELWDIDRLMNELNDALKKRLISRAKIQASSAQITQKSKFTFGDIFINEVPCRVGKLQSKLHEPPQLMWAHDTMVMDTVKGISSSLRNRSWMLIVGNFGSGKSLLAQRLSVLKNRDVIYIPASELHHTDIGSASENSLMRLIVQYLRIFDEDSEFNETERKYLQHLAGPLLAAELRSQESQFVLIVDGLDENRSYSSVNGLQLLANELGRTSCPIILTIRKEYFYDHFFALSSQLLDGEKVGRVVEKKKPEQIVERGKHRPKNDAIQVTELSEWQHTQVISYIDAAIESALEESHGSLREFRGLILAGELNGRFFLEHPLLLAMTVDLIAERGSASALHNRAALYKQWVDLKLSRDFSKDRLLPGRFENIGLVMHQLVEVMTDVAGAMVTHEGGRYELLDSINETTIRGIAKKRFDDLSVPTTLYSTTSLLDPVHQRSSEMLEFKFFHRSFQEYFLALSTVRNQQNVRDYPKSVQDFVFELT